MKLSSKDREFDRALQEHLGKFHNREISTINTELAKKLWFSVSKAAQAVPYAVDTQEEIRRKNEERRRMLNELRSKAGL